ncbi:hypothetical protein N9F06_01575 [Gammaproteobacteria bacterium]|nr:hypothetical protein [Gammaproteobacteria bacterium]
MSEEARNFLNSYGDFVTKVTSEPSMNQLSLDERMKEIDSSSPIESARLLTAALGRHHVVLGYCLYGPKT